MSFKLKNHNIIFIHPPKCGGSSITECLKSVDGIGEKISVGAHKSIIGNEKLNFVADEYFITVRNPYDRYYSYYHFAIEWDLKRASGELPLKGDTVEFYLERRQKLIDMKFEGFINILTNENEKDNFIEKHKLKNAFKLQVDWYLNQTKKKVNVFKIEEGEVWPYLQNLGYDIKRKHLKKTTYKTQKGYSEQQAEIVYKYFKKDFDILNYSKEDYERKRVI